MKDNPQVLRRIYRGAYLAAFAPSLTSFLGNFAGMLMVGNKLGPVSLATAGLINPLSLLFVAVGSLFGYGGVLTSSQLIGKGEHRKSREAYTTAYLATFLFCLMSAVVFIVMLPDILMLMKVPAEFYANAYRSGAIILLTGFFTAGMILTAGFLRLDGLNKEVIFFTILTPILTISTNVILILFSGWGIEGLAVSLAVGNGAAFGGMAYTLFRKSNSVKFVRVKIVSFFKLAGRIFINGIASASDEIAFLVSMPLINAVIINGWGTLALSAYSAYNPMQGITLCLVIANSQALMPLLGVFSSEHDSESSRQVLRVAIYRGLATTIPAGIAIMLFAKPICMSFGLNTPELLGYAVPLMMILGVKIPLAMVSNSLINVHNAFGNVIISNVLNIGRAAGFLLPTVYILSARFGLGGVWHAFWVCEVLTILVSFAYSLIRSKRDQNLSRIWLIDRRYALHGKYMSFSCDAAPEDIARCAGAVDDFCRENCLVSSRSILISLATEEMLTLIATHSLTGKDDFMNTRVVVYENEVILRIRNGGLEFNPLDYYYLSEKTDGHFTAEDMLALDDKLGIKMVRDSARDIDYRRTFGVNNLTVTL